MKICGASWEIALEKSQYSLANELCTFCPAASFSRFRVASFTRREREREWESGIDNGFDLIMRNGSAF